MLLAFGVSVIGSSACLLTTDLDGFSSGGLPVDGGSDGGGDEAGHPVIVNEAGSDGGGAEAGPDGGSTYGDLIAADHPVAYFPFDEPITATLISEKITGKNANLNPAHFTPGVPGIAGTALEASGNGELDFGDNFDILGSDPYSLEAWIKPIVHDGKGFYEFINKRQGGSNGIVCYVRHESGNSVQIEQSYGGAGRGANAGLSDLDHFIHIVFVYDPGNTGLRVWVDGKVSLKGYDDPGGPSNNSQSIYIASGVEGTVDEMAIYDYALPEARILAHLAAGKQP